MSLVFKSVFLLCLLTLLSSNKVLGKTHVKITNTLEGGLDLTVHCKSKDDDIGVQYLHPNASFGFSFKPNFFGTTQFYCSFQWKNAFHWFDIYIENRDDKRCHECYWDVKKDGPCLTTSNDQSIDCYPWNDSLKVKN
ncbi:hypothetical protein Fmac_017629 [Flemingia macrophylla]|uniref:S-protein homolog n=1 Tax=Flemingia macrophylla TaxID=520843 RepID=A0ABD1M3C4_9FABA